MSKKTLTAVKKRFKKQIIDTHQHVGDETIIIAPGDLRDVAEALKTDEKLDFNFLMDITAVDYLKRKPRFEVVYHFYSMAHNARLRVKVVVEEGEETVPSLSDLWRSANWAEREVWDMYGIRFDGHPDLRRILMYEEFEGHPLRKDYPIQLSQPRMDLRLKERDAVEEYHSYYLRRDDEGAAE